MSLEWKTFRYLFGLAIQLLCIFIHFTSCAPSPLPHTHTYTHEVIGRMHTHFNQEIWLMLTHQILGYRVRESQVSKVKLCMFLILLWCFLEEPCKFITFTCALVSAACSVWRSETEKENGENRKLRRLLYCDWIFCFIREEQEMAKSTALVIGYKRMFMITWCHWITN